MWTIASTGVFDHDGVRLVLTSAGQLPGGERLRRTSASVLLLGILHKRRRLLCRFG